jgi:copper resistance protein D
VAAQLLDLFAFLSVLFRGGGLALNSLMWGGVMFGLWTLRPVVRDERIKPAWASCRRLLFWSAAALAFVQLSYLASDSAILAGTAGLGLGDLASANFFVASLVAIASAIAITILARAGRYSPQPYWAIPAAAALAAMVTMSHAAGRLEYRPALYLLTLLHQAATASWVGGMPYLLLVLARCRDGRIARTICSRFSAMALISVATLVLSGSLMSWAYVGSPAAIYGTSYGAMLASKVILLSLLMILGGLNFLILRQHPAVSALLLPSLRRFAEAEVGIGFTAILAAASLTSQPPAVDMPRDRLTMPEIVQRMHPVWPNMETPPLSSLSPPTPLSFDRNEAAPAGLTSFVPGVTYHPSTPGDIEWSEYNHHWSGVIVLAAGLLAVLARSGFAGWARHWPLAFLGLAVFLFLRSDPENWPLGPRSFWQSFASTDVLQHRVFVLLVVLFAGFEWGVRTGRITNPRAGFVFPAVCAVGGALLLTHSHALGNIKEELLAELSHIPLAICAVIAGWSRWLELRLSGTSRQVPAWIWPICFVLIGSVLLNYREA